MKTGYVPVAACCIGLILSVGCVMPDQLSQIQKDLADVRHELREIQREQAEVLQKLAEVEAPRADPDPVTRAEMADVTLSLQQVSRDVAISDERLNDLGRRMDRVVEDVARGRQQPVRRSALPPPNIDPPGDSLNDDPLPAGGAAVPDPGPSRNLHLIHLRP